jgi:hypothetical protein
VLVAPAHGAVEREERERGRERREKREERREKREREREREIPALVRSGGAP